MMMLPIKIVALVDNIGDKGIYTLLGMYQLEAQQATT